MNCVYKGKLWSGVFRIEAAHWSFSEERMVELRSEVQQEPCEQRGKKRWAWHRRWQVQKRVAGRRQGRVSLQGGRSASGWLFGNELRQSYRGGTWGMEKLSESNTTPCRGTRARYSLPTMGSLRAFTGVFHILGILLSMCLGRWSYPTLEY